MKKRARIALQIVSLVMFLSGALLAQNDRLISDALTLEFTIGGEHDTNTDEYLLVRPFMVAVNAAGDILTSDEYSIKVYDRNGEPKRIVGGRGQGPGEFDQIPNPLIAPNGFLTAVERSPSPAGNTWYYTVFDGDLEFVVKENVQFDTEIEEAIRRDLPVENEMNRDFQVRNAMAFSEDEILFHVTEQRYPAVDGFFEQYEILLYSIAGSVRVVYSGRNPGKVPMRGRQGFGDPGFLGDFYSCALPGKKVAVCTNDEDLFNNDASIGFIHIIDPQSEERTIIEHTSVLKEIDEGPPDIPLTSMWMHLGEEQAKKREKEFFERWKKQRIERKYLPAVNGLLADGAYLFVGTRHPHDPAERCTVVYDTKNGERVAAADFRLTTVNNRDYVRNGRLHRVVMDGQGFYSIEVYRIDPAVYRK